MIGQNTIATNVSLKGQMGFLQGLLVNDLDLARQSLNNGMQRIENRPYPATC